MPDLFAENAFFVHTEKAFYTVAFLATGQTTQQKSVMFFSLRQLESWLQLSAKQSDGLFRIFVTCNGKSAVLQLVFYYKMMFTNLPGIAITFLGVAPARSCCTV